MRLELHAVVAMTPSRVIGKGNALPWHLPEDLKQFKKLTTGHAILMGRKTWESIGRPLPKRRNLVLSRSELDLEGAEVIHCPEDLVGLGLDTEAFVIGGAEVYRLLLPYCRGIYLTQVFKEYDGDVFFPEFDGQFVKGETLFSNEDFETRYWENLSICPI
jgi:dihydrofolate reductase